MPTLDEILDAERRACSNTSSNEWRERCEAFHLAKLAPAIRGARLGELHQEAPARAARLEQAIAELCLQASAPAARTEQRAEPARRPAPTRNPGTAWTLAHDAELAALAESGKKLPELAQFFGRSEQVLAQRLDRMGYPILR